jgi:hypothetical protein
MLLSLHSFLDSLKGASEGSSGEKMKAWLNAEWRLGKSDDPALALYSPVQYDGLYPRKVSMQVFSSSDVLMFRLPH